MIRIKRKRRFILFVLSIIVLFVLLSGMFLLTWFNKGSGPLSPGNTEIVSVNIPRGSGTKAIGEILESEGVISSWRIFQLKAKLSDNDGKFKAGDYSLSPGMDIDTIINELLVGKGSGNTVRFTIPEGYDLKKIADKLEEQGLISRENFFQEIESGQFDYWFVKDLKAGKDRLEGYLYPETYEIYVDSNEHQIIDKMLAQFNKVFTEAHISQMEASGRSLEEIMILASIIEREAVVSEDRPVIAGVFLSRLDIQMPLQSCATIQYILGEQKPVLSTADTRIPSPYNTYLNAGLPPAPICSPGIESINASLWPEITDYLYFLAKGDGSHVFSKTYEEHLRNKAIYID
jgi:UPF0755 protein